MRKNSENFPAPQDIVICVAASLILHALFLGWLISTLPVGTSPIFRGNKLEMLFLQIPTSDVPFLKEHQNAPDFNFTTGISADRGATSGPVPFRIQPAHGRAQPGQRSSDTIKSSKPAAPPMPRDNAAGGLARSARKPRSESASDQANFTAHEQSQASDALEGRSQELSGSKQQGGIAPQAAVFGSASGPSFFRYNAPPYPEQARRMGIHGTVKIVLQLDQEGRLVFARVLESPHRLLSDSAMRSIKKATFRPLIINGKPQSCTTELAIRFNLE